MAKPGNQRVENLHSSRTGAWLEHHGYSVVASLGRLLRKPWASLLTIGVMALALALPLGLWVVLVNVQRLGGQVQGTSQTLTVPSAMPSVYYVATVTDQCGVEASDSVLVSQAPPVPLVLTLTPDTAIPCHGHADLIASVVP